MCETIHSFIGLYFYPLGKQFSGESSSSVVSACSAVVVSMEIPLAAQNAHTHTHALQGCNVARQHVQDNGEVQLV